MFDCKGNTLHIGISKDLTFKTRYFSQRKEIDLSVSFALLSSALGPRVLRPLLENCVTKTGVYKRKQSRQRILVAPRRVVIPKTDVSRL